MLIDALVPLTVIIILSAVPAAFKNRWARRSISYNTRDLWVVSVVTLVTITTATVILSPPLTVALAYSAAAGIFGISAATDIYSGRMPKELAWMGGTLGIILAVFASGFGVFGFVEYFLTIAILAGIPYLMWFTGRGIGMGDVRLLFAVAALTAWWAGPIAPLVIFIVSVIFQLVFRLLSKPLKLGLRVYQHSENGKIMPFGPGLYLGYMIVATLALFGIFLPTI